MAAIFGVFVLVISLANVTFLVQFFKVLLVIVLMLLSGRLFQGLNWLVFLSVLAVVMNSQFLLIFKK